VLDKVAQVIKNKGLMREQLKIVDKFFESAQDRV